MSVIRCVTVGCGSYLPARVLTNNDLARMVDTSDDWITQRTGIRERHVAADGEMTSDLALAAARAALADAKVDAQSIDLIVLATSTPDNTFPATAVAVQAGLGITHGAAFDLQAVCSGFVYALATVDGLLRTGAFRRALVIGAETYSRILDWKDRATCVLFGDGAGAFVVEAVAQQGTYADRGLLATRLRSDGRHKTKLYVDGGPSSTGTVGKVRMDLGRGFRRIQVHGLYGRGHRLVCAASGQQAHHRRFGAQARHRARKDRDDGRSAWQHIGCLDSARGGRRCGRRADQARRSAALGGYGRRVYLGSRAIALVMAMRTVSLLTRIDPVDLNCQAHIVDYP